MGEPSSWSLSAIAGWIAVLLLLLLLLVLVLVLVLEHPTTDASGPSLQKKTGATGTSPLSCGALMHDVCLIVLDGRCISVSDVPLELVDERHLGAEDVRVGPMVVRVPP